MLIWAVAAIPSNAPNGDSGGFTIGAIVGVAVGVVALISAAVAAVRWWLAHRPIRVAVKVQIESATVFFAVTNQRQTADFEGRVTNARGISQQVIWPWTLKWRHSPTAAERIAKKGTSVLQLAEAQYFMAAKGDWIYSAPTSVRLTDPAGVIRDLSLPAGDDAFWVSWAGVELDVELSALGHFGSHALLTVRLRFVPDADAFQQISVEIVGTQGGVS